MYFFGEKVIIKQDEINEQKGQNPNIIKQAGQNESEGKILKINKQACSFIQYLRVGFPKCTSYTFMHASQDLLPE